jgi:hypothetical protein
VHPQQAFDIVQRCHTVFWEILSFENWGVESKICVLNACLIVTTDAEDGVFFLIDQGYLCQIARYLEREETVRHDARLIKLALMTFSNLLLGCLTKGHATQDTVTRICRVKNLMESLCTLVIEPIPLRQEWAMRALGHLFTMAKWHGLARTLSEEAEEQGLWEQVNKIYNTSPDDTMTALAESLIKVQDKTADMDCYGEDGEDGGRFHF